MQSIKGLLSGINGTSGGLTITGGNGAIGSSNNIDIFTFDGEHNSGLYKKYEIYESTEDLLALSCAWYRLRVEASKHNKGSGISKLLDRQLFSYVTEEDKTLAAKVRDYYSKKIMMLKLKNERMSKFTEDLNKFIHSDGTKFVEETFGLVYRLPQFYFYDTELDSIFSGRNRVVQKGKLGKEVKTLSHIGTTVVDRRTCKRNEYWFSDENDNVVALYLGKDNPLIGIFEQVIKHSVSLEGLYYAKHKGDTEYYQIEKYNLVI